MELVNRSLHALVFSNSWIAIGAASSTYYFCYHYSIASGAAYSVLVAFLTFTSYNFQRLLKIKNKEIPTSIRHCWIHKHAQLLKVLTCLGGLISLFFVYYVLTIKILLFSLPIGLMVLFYAQLFSHFKGIRSVPVLKNGVTALVWTYTLICVPFFIQQSDVSFLQIVENELPILSAIFIFIFAVSLTFDIRDAEQDKGKIITLVRLIGINASKIVMIFSFVFSLIVANQLNLLGFQIVLILAIILTLFTNDKKSEFFFSLLWDGLLLLLSLFLIIEKLS